MYSRLFRLRNTTVGIRLCTSKWVPGFPALLASVKKPLMLNVRTGSSQISYLSYHLWGFNMSHKYLLPRQYTPSKNETEVCINAGLFSRRWRNCRQGTGRQHYPVTVTLIGFSPQILIYLSIYTVDRVRIIHLTHSWHRHLRPLVSTLRLVNPLFWYNRSSTNPRRVMPVCRIPSVPHSVPIIFLWNRNSQPTLNRGLTSFLITSHLTASGYRLQS